MPDLYSSDKQGNSPLMNAVIENPSAVPHLLKAIGREDFRDQFFLLTRANNKHFNAVMLAARYDARTIPSLLAAMGSNTKAKVFLQVNDEDFNALLLAALYQPNAIATLLAAMSDDVKQRVLNDISYVLRQAACHESTAIEPILAALAKMPHDVQRRIFIRVNGDGDNALMLAARYRPRVVPLLLNAMSSYIQVRVFEQSDVVGDNSLMIAARYQSSVIPLLVNEMSVEVKQRVFGQVCRWKYNALMIAASHNLSAVEPLLRLMPDNLKPQIFEQKSNDGFNVLMLAVRHNPDAIPSLLSAIPEESKLQVFKQVAQDGWNVLMLAARYAPQAIPFLLAALPEDTKQQLFKQVHKNGFNALMFAARDELTSVTQLLEVMPSALKKKIFEQDDKAWFGRGINCIRLILSQNNIETVLTLLSEKVIAPKGRTFKRIVACKQQLLDYILAQDIEESRYALLKEIHDNKPGSLLAQVFHTSRGILKPQITRGILGQAEKEYLELHQKRQESHVVDSPSVMRQGLAIVSPLYPIIKSDDPLFYFDKPLHPSTADNEQQQTLLLSVPVNINEEQAHSYSIS